MRRTGDIPQELEWTVLVLISKGTTNTRGIGMLETLWKVVELMMDTHLRASLHMYNVLHGFKERRGTGTDITELNISQEIVIIDQYPLFLVFLDLGKAYDTVDQELLLITLELEVYGGVPRLCGILETF